MLISKTPDKPATSRPLVSGLLLLGLIGLISSAAWAQPAATTDRKQKQRIAKREPTRFLRVTHDEYKNPISLQTATARYVLLDTKQQPKLEVFLESVVHIGDAAYYKSFNRRFKHYDTVLYELVAPSERLIPEAIEESDGLARLLQQLAASSLGFTNQLEIIDYRAPNLVHSDLSPSELQQAMKDRGETPVTLIMESMLQALKQMNKELELPETPQQPATFDFAVFADPDGAVHLRRMMAQAFVKGPSLEAAIPANQRALLITDRNERAMKVFQDQIDQGKRRISLFWGAGHMEDFERRLVLGYGLQPAGVTWRNAWDLREGAVNSSPLESILETTLKNALKDLSRPPESRP